MENPIEDEMKFTIKDEIKFTIDEYDCYIYYEDGNGDIEDRFLIISILDENMNYYTSLYSHFIWDCKYITSLSELYDMIIIFLKGDSDINLSLKRSSDDVCIVLTQHVPVDIHLEMVIEHSDSNENWVLMLKMTKLKNDTDKKIAKLQEQMNT